MNLSPTEHRLYKFLQGKVGEIVPYSSFEKVISVKKGTANLRAAICRLRRKKGHPIDNVQNRGYRLRMLSKMPICEVDSDAQFYAQDVQQAIFAAMQKHAEIVGFESQIAIMGVAIGAILHQLPESDRKYFTKLLVKNINLAPQFSEIMRVQ